MIVGLLDKKDYVIYSSLQKKKKIPVPVLLFNWISIEHLR